MGVQELKTMKDQLMGCIQGQMGNLGGVDTKELGEAIDMVKDLSEAIYYCTITEAMEKTDEPKEINNINYYTSPTYNRYPDYRDMERSGGYMYYPTGGGSGNSGGGGNNSGNSGSNGSRGSGGTGSNTSYYTEMPYEMMRDPRQGRAAIRRRMYMEGKEQHKDTNSQLRELEAYLEQLSSDVVEMVKDASPEERATLRQKMTTLANKIV